MKTTRYLATASANEDPKSCSTRARARSIPAVTPAELHTGPSRKKIGSDSTRTLGKRRASSAQYDQCVAARGNGFDCFTKDAIGNLGVADWHGREAIRENLRAFIDTGFTAHHEVLEYWDGGSLKVFHGIVTMKPNDSSKPIVKPVMSHFLYMDEKDPTKVRHWIGAVGPVQF